MLAAVKQLDGPPDVVLLDVMMPGLDGMATLRALKAAKPETQVIMLSGRNQTATIVEAVRLGAADYVVKPENPEGLGEIALDVAIRNAIEKNRLVVELTELRQQISDDQDRAIWGQSEKMRAIQPVPDGPISLATVARAAAIRAERTAIERTLRQVHSNRRKAAQLLGVSYKTLLNRITECGIGRP